MSMRDFKVTQFLVQLFVLHFGIFDRSMHRVSESSGVLRASMPGLSGFLA